MTLGKRGVVNVVFPHHAWALFVLYIIFCSLHRLQCGIYISVCYTLHVIVLYTVQTHNSVDDVREGIKEGFSNLKHEMMVGTGLLIVYKMGPLIQMH